MQTSLTKMYVHWADVSASDAPLAYAHRVLVNVAIDESRRPFRRREMVTETVLGGRAPTHAADPVDLDTRRAVLAALASLPPRQRAVVVLRHWLDYSVQHTADALRCAPGTVKSQNAKALASLHERLKHLNVDLLRSGGVHE